MRRAKQIRESQKAAAEHQYAEAFHLMLYMCKSCGDIEPIWNSRNGVTPFCIRCSNCGAVDMEHINWHSDLVRPDYQPKIGERIFVGKPEEPKLIVYSGQLLS